MNPMQMFGNMQNMMSKFQQQGINPQQQVMQLLQSGKMSQQQFEQLKQMASMLSGNGFFK